MAKVTISVTIHGDGWGGDVTRVVEIDTDDVYPHLSLDDRLKAAVAAAYHSADEDATTRWWNS